MAIDELTFEFDKTKDHSIDFLVKHSFKRLLEKLNVESVSKSNRTKVNTNEKINFKNRKINYKLITNLNDLEEIISICNEKDIIAIDCETNSLNSKTSNLVGVSIAYDIGKAVYIPLRHIKNENDLSKRRMQKIFLNKYHLRML